MSIIAFVDTSHHTAARKTASVAQISRQQQASFGGGILIERLWRSLKYECVYLHAFETGSELRAGLSHWIGYYNARRPHSALSGRTPDEAYSKIGMERLAA